MRSSRNSRRSAGVSDSIQRISERSTPSSLYSGAGAGWPYSIPRDFSIADRPSHRNRSRRYFPTGRELRSYSALNSQPISAIRAIMYIQTSSAMPAPTEPYIRL